MQMRYGNVVSPGDNRPEKHTVIRFDQAIADKYDGLSQKRSELNSRLRAGYGKQDDLIQAMGLAIASGEDWSGHAEQLSFLRLEGEALEAGILYLNGQCELMKRLNSWLK